MSSSTPGRGRKLPPIHPGEILNDEFLVPLKISQYRLARSVGVDPHRVHAIVHGERSVTAETALLFSRFFGNSAEFWMGLQSQYDLEREQDRLADRSREGGGVRRSIRGLSDPYETHAPNGILSCADSRNRHTALASLRMSVVDDGERDVRASGHSPRWR